MRKNTVCTILLAAVILFSSTACAFPGTDTPIVPLSDVSASAEIPDADGITSDTVMEYTYGTKQFVSEDPGKKVYVYDFTDSGASGVGMDGANAPTRMYYGISGAVDNKNHIWRVTPYNDYPDLFDLSIESVEFQSDTQTTALPATFRAKSIDISGLENGLYRAVVNFSNGESSSVFLYINGGTAYTCTSGNLTDDEVGYIKTRTERIRALLEAYEITPQNSLNMTRLAYPTSPIVYPSFRCDVDLWADVSRSLVTSGMTPEAKVFAFHEWMTQNLTYDYYSAYTVPRPRQNYYDDFSGKWSVYNTHAGKCTDFGNIMTIMCRAQGIPCNIIDTDYHTWNIVYLNGKWREIDLTRDIHAFIYGLDMTVVEEPETRYCYDSLLSPALISADLEPSRINDSLATVDILTGKRQYSAPSLLTDEADR